MNTRLRATPNELLHDYPLLTIPETMHILSLSRSKVYELMNEKRLRTMHYGRRVMVNTADVQQFMDESFKQSEERDVTETAAE